MPMACCTYVSFASHHRRQSPQLRFQLHFVSGPSSISRDGRFNASSWSLVSPVKFASPMLTVAVHVHQEIMMKTDILGSTLLKVCKRSVIKTNSFCQMLLRLKSIKVHQLTLKDYHIAMTCPLGKGTTDQADYDAIESIPNHNHTLSWS